MLKYNTSKELLRLSQVFSDLSNKKFTCFFDNIGNLYSITYIIFYLMFQCEVYHLYWRLECPLFSHSLF